jgi:hypothetical protein
VKHSPSKAWTLMADGAVAGFIVLTKRAERGCGAPVENVRSLNERACFDEPEWRAAAVLPFGIAEVDAHVPGGGLQLGRLHEVSRAEQPANMRVSRRSSQRVSSRVWLGRSCGVCAAAISLRQHLRESAFIPTGSFTARRGMTAKSSRRWRKD